MAAPEIAKANNGFTNQADGYNVNRLRVRRVAFPASPRSVDLIVPTAPLRKVKTLSVAESYQQT